MVDGGGTLQQISCLLHCSWTGPSMTVKKAATRQWAKHGGKHGSEDNFEAVSKYDFMVRDAKIVYGPSTVASSVK